MSVDEELKEHSEHAKDPFDKRVAASMAIIAAGLAIVTVLGHLSTTEELINQQLASDQWSYYQAKSIRRYNSEIAHDVMNAFKDESSKKTAEKYAGKVETYKKEGEEIQEKARDFEKESRLAGRKALRFHLGEVFLEIGIVLASLAILTKRMPFWLGSLVTAFVGVVIAVTSRWVA